MPLSLISSSRRGANISLRRLTIAIAQINATVGDIDGNVSNILSQCQLALAAGASLVVTPELALCGYPPEDLLLRRDFHAACARGLQRLSAELPLGVSLLVGHPDFQNGKCYNAASVIEPRQAPVTYHKHILPNHTVFDEVRYFSQGSEPLVFTHHATRLGVLICADVWETEPAKLSMQAGAEVLLVLNASPFHLNKQETRHQAVADRAAETGLSLVYVNLVGAQDELVFDGGSFVLNASGNLVQQLPMFEPALSLVSFERLQDGSLQALPSELAPTPAPEPALYQALCLGLRDYVNKNSFPGVLLGLSGGIDSALTLAIAVDAVGADKVHAVMMPSPYTATMSLEDARIMVKTLGVRYDEIPIGDLKNAYTETLAAIFANTSPPAADTTDENLQARIRATLLMAISNKLGSLLLTTGNKSEVAVGYATLYGDMAGGFSVLKDVVKTMVYRLSRYRNGIAPVIPERVLLRAPSAELKPGQTDQDNLPSYEVLDAILEAHVEHEYGWQEIIGMGFHPDDVAKVLSLIHRSEYKRQQAAPGVRVTARGFGKDWRYPITSRFLAIGQSIQSKSE